MMLVFPVMIIISSARSRNGAAARRKRLPCDLSHGYCFIGLERCSSPALSMLLTLARMATTKLTAPV